MNPRHAFAVLPIAAALAFPPPAGAQEIGIGYQKKNVSIGISIGNHGAPVHYAPRPIRYETREWIPSHYETIAEQTWVSGCEERVFVAAVHEWRTDACGRWIKVVVSPAHYETRCAPGHWATVTRQVWVEGGWRVRPCR
jgi:hypothetical protein